MAVINYEENAKTVPRMAVPVFQVVAKPGAKIGCKANVIKFVAPVERINAVAASHVLFDYVLVFLQRLARNVFKVLAN